MKVRLITCTPDAERTVAVAARNCYSALGPERLAERMTDEECESFLSRIASLGHTSVLEHAGFTFGLENVSRSLLAELTRHRIASFSVKSQRYVTEKNFGYIVPPTVRDNPEALRLYEDILKREGEAYEQLLALGIPREDARFVLPNACCTHIVMTMNARELLHFFRLRCCNRAQWEIRALADAILALCREEAPLLFAKAGPACVWEDCPEGKMSCGRMKDVRARYRGESHAV